MCLSQAVTKNPGYLNLRKIRVARNIAKTCRDTFDDGEADLVSEPTLTN